PEEESSLVDKTVVLVGGVWLKDVSLLLQDTADVVVDALEVVLELWITIGIGIEIVKSIKEIIQAGVVGESLNENFEVSLSSLNVVVLSDALVLAGRVLCKGLSMIGIVLCKVKKGIDGLLVVLVILDFDNHLLHSPNSLITAFPWD